MIPPETSDFAPISVGIATLNRRLNEDDALSGNMAAGGRGRPSGSSYSYAIHADSQAGARAVEARPHTRTTRQSSCTGFIPLPGDNPNLAVALSLAKPTDSGLSLISFPDRESSTVRQDDSSGNIRGDLLSVGIATLNRRLNKDDALSGNMAAGSRRREYGCQRVAGYLPAAPTATQIIRGTPMCLYRGRVDASPRPDYK